MQRSISAHFITLAASAVFSAAVATAANVPLIAANRARVAVVLPATAHPDERLAADELCNHMKLMTGIELPVIATGSDRAEEQVPLFIGEAADPTLDAEIRKQGNDPASFALRVTTDRIDIRGLSPEGTLFGAYELLEQLGVRWFMPGEIGRVAPREQSRLVLKAQLTVQVPSFPARWMHGAMKQSVWQRRMRMGGFFVPPAHGGVPRNISDPMAIQERADSIVKALRERDANRTDPYIVAIGPPDRPRWFDDNEASLALDANDYDPFLGAISRTDRLMWFYSRILEQVDREIPDANVRILFYAYHSYFRPPVRKDEVDDRIIPAFAPITLCRVHGMGAAICPEKEYYRHVLQGWHEAVPTIYKRGYYFNLACPGVPFSMVHRLRREIPIAHALGVKGFRQEVIPKWGSETPSLYLAARLMWNHNTDVDALLTDFCHTFFGPAAEPMGQYLDMMDAALRDADHHAGCSFDVLQWYPNAIREHGHRLLVEAADRADQSPYTERVAAFRGTFDFMEALCHMLLYRAHHHYEAAQAEVDRMHELIETLGSQDPGMLHPRYSTSYLNRFFANATAQGYERVTGDNRLVAGLNDVWIFRIDPDDEGEAAGYYQPDYVIDETAIDGEVGYQQPDPLAIAQAARGAVSDVGLKTDKPWQRVRTSTITWDSLGLRYYKERPAWYRQSVRIPPEADGANIYLWFGGVDDWAKVWVNGVELGTGSGAFRPFEFDATDAVRPGENNLVVVKVLNRGLSELGTGGIMAPVMFYARNTELVIDPDIEFPEFPLY